MTSDKYCKATVDNVDKMLTDKWKKLPNKWVTPLKSGYRPEEYVSQKLGADGLQAYRELIGALQWAVKIGHVDILLETSMMSTHLALPRLGHLEQVFHIFGYLKERPKRKLALDTNHPVIDEKKFVRHDWMDFYRDATEAIPGDIPPPRGRLMSTHMFVDADLAGNKITSRF